MICIRYREEKQQMSSGGKRAGGKCGGAMDAYVIIGGPNTRKSSVTRSLTGCFNRNVRNILLNNGEQIKIYARVTALQESKTTAEEFLTEVSQSGCQNVIFCLWPQPSQIDPKKYPDASTYISTLRAAGWNIVRAAVLGQGRPSLLCPQQAFFPNSEVDPINQTAQAVRANFGWR